MAHFGMTWRKCALPEVKLPEGYSIRTYQRGDEAGWLRCCNGGELGTESWTDGQFEREMLHGKGICAESIYFVVDAQGTIAATTTAICGENTGTVHMVAADKAYRGKGLAKAVCTAVMHHLVHTGYEHITLETDDFRLSAIHIYESLGFVRDEPAEQSTSATGAE